MTRAVAAFVGLLLLLPGCSLMHNRPEMLKIRAQPCQVGTAPGIVYVVDGAGNFLGTSIGMRQAAQDAHFPLTIHTFEWGHGWCRVLADHLDRPHIQTVGERLAEEIKATRWQVGPDVPIHIVAQSGGCPVALVAGENLPPNSVNQIILLAPPSSADYNLVHTLEASREQVHVFWSPNDVYILGLWTHVFGTSDGYGVEPAGRVGFRTPKDDPAAQFLYDTKLKQHRWEPALKHCGYDGGHLCTNKHSVLRECVLPLLGAEKLDQ